MAPAEPPKEMDLPSGLKEHLPELEVAYQRLKGKHPKQPNGQPMHFDQWLTWNAKAREVTVAEPQE